MLLVSRTLRDRLSFDALGRFAVRRRWWIVAAWAVVLLAALPFAPRAPAALSAGGFILDDLESARAKQLLQDELGVEAVGVRAPVHVDTLTAGHARVAGGGRGRDAGRRRRAARDPDPVARPRAAPGLRRRPHRLRHRVPRPPARRLARTRSRASLAAPPRGPGPRRPDRRRAGVLRRRPGRVRDATCAQRADLAAARRARAAARVRLASSRRACRSPSAARRCSSRWRRSSSSRA